MRPPLDPAKAFEIAKSLNYRHIDETVIAVAQDAKTGEVLMVGHMDMCSVIMTLATGMAHYWSTSRKKLWLKGESSRNYQYVEEFVVDCDGDAVLLKVVQIGAACHTGSRSCFDGRRSRG